MMDGGFGRPCEDNVGCRCLNHEDPPPKRGGGADGDGGRWNLHLDVQQHSLLLLNPDAPDAVLAFPIGLGPIRGKDDAC